MVQSDVKLSTGTWPKRPSPFSRYVLPLGPVVAAHLPTLAARRRFSPSGLHVEISVPGAILKALVWESMISTSLARVLRSRPGSPGCQLLSGHPGEHLLSPVKRLSAIEQGTGLPARARAFCACRTPRWLRLVASTSSAIRFFWRKSAAARATKESFQGRFETPTRVMPLRTLSYELKSRVAGLAAWVTARSSSGRMHAHILWKQSNLRRRLDLGQESPFNGDPQRKLVTSCTHPRPARAFRRSLDCPPAAPDCCHIEIQTLPRSVTRSGCSITWAGRPPTPFGSGKAIPAVRVTWPRAKTLAAQTAKTCSKLPWTTGRCGGARAVPARQVERPHSCS